MTSTLLFFQTEGTWGSSLRRNWNCFSKMSSENLLLHLCTGHWSWKGFKNKKYQSWWLVFFSSWCILLFLYGQIILIPVMTDDDRCSCAWYPSAERSPLSSHQCCHLKGGHREGAPDSVRAEIAMQPVQKCWCSLVVLTHNNLWGDVNYFCPRLCVFHSFSFPLTFFFFPFPFSCSFILFFLCSELPAYCCSQPTQVFKLF